MNAVSFMLPQVVGGNWWRCLLDTNHVDGFSAAYLPVGAVFEASGRSLHLFELTSEAPPVANDQGGEKAGAQPHEGLSPRPIA
jgi:hypothetical protein